MNEAYLEYMLYESDVKPVGLPEGVTFLSDGSSDVLDEKITDLCRIYREKKYKKVLPPIFEYYETFEKGSGQNIARRSFSFKDKDGKLLSLRYDMTTPIARMVSMRFHNDKLPLRFYYRGDVFREQPSHAGKPRQISQVGIEVVGDDSIDADVEVVRMLGLSLRKLAKTYTIVLGDVRLFRRLLSQLKLTQSQTEAVSVCMSRKDTASLSRIIAPVEGISEYKELLVELPGIVGSMSEVGKRMNDFADTGMGIYVERLTKIVSKLTPAERKHIIIDLSLIKDFSYYTSVTLEGYIPTVGFAIANGGRYDELFTSFGKNYPAIGFAIDMSYSI